VRDRYGVKPLYWTREAGTLLFASEMKALLRHRRRNEVDLQSLSEWWLYRNVDALTPESLVEGVVQLLPGHLARIRGGAVEIAPWYAVHAQVDADEYGRLAALSPEAVVDEIEASLDQSVRLRLVSDVPVGTLLSGGLDSNLITAMAARHTPDLTAFHVSVGGHSAMDERPFAETLARDHRIPFVPMELTASGFRSALAHVTWLEDLPLTHANSVAYHLIGRTARQHGVTVLLSGEGADELFGGYAWNYRRRMRLARLQPWLDRLPGPLHAALELLVYGRAGLPVTLRRFRELLPPTVGVLDRFARAEEAQRCAQAYGFVGKAAERDALGAMLADLGDFLAPLLRRLDRTTMGASVECREPFLDHRLVHKAINLPLAWRLGRRADKWVLKQIATRHMREELIWRRKMGFPLPLADYIAPLATPAFFAGGFCEQGLGLGRRGIERLLADWRRWTFGAFGLLTLEMWGRMSLMGDSVDAMSDRVAAIERATAGGRPLDVPARAY
jgi:asparagine synthase (glutamine-hydrolysing)